MRDKSICSRAHYLFRQFLAGLCFVSFGIGGLFISTIIFPLLRLITWNKITLRKRIRGTIQNSFKIFVGMLHYSHLFNFKFECLQELKEDRGTIIVANHPSLIDVVVLMSVVSDVSCIVKSSLFKNLLLGGVVRGADYIPNDSKANLMDLCEEKLSRGENLIIFPEGTRSVVGKPMELTRGAAQLAFRLQVPLRVVKLTVIPVTLTKGLPWYIVPSIRALFLVQVKNLISIERYLDAGLKPSIAARRITSEIGRAIDSQVSL